MEGLKLFSSVTKRGRADVEEQSSSESGSDSDESAGGSPTAVDGADVAAASGAGGAGEDGPDPSSIATDFSSLGLSRWLVTSVSKVGIVKPTPVQRSCIPAVLSGRDVLAGAPTGSGKTAAFALPIIERLSEDPYGIFAVILTPSRELAAQIDEQFAAFGVGCGLKHALVIGGMDQARQSAQLELKPHVVVATPGRLAHVLQAGSATPPSFRRVKFVVLDEADRLFDSSFAPAMSTIFGALPPGSRRQTLLFSATMTDNIKRLEDFAVKDPFRWMQTQKATTVAGLQQHYLFMPAAVKMAYLVYLMRTVGPEMPEGMVTDGSILDVDGAPERTKGSKGKKRPSKRKSAKQGKASLAGGEATEALTKALGRATSCIIFTATQHGAQLLAETLTEMGVLCAPLHSVMTQRRRLAALGKFKSSIVHVLIATDVASRGLDIPEVELVINYDVPRNPDDYIHRVGRTARAGRGGRAISLVTQYDVDLIHRIEGKIEQKLEELDGVEEKAVLARLNKVATAERVARMRLAETGFEDRLAEAKDRKRRGRIEQDKFLAGETSKRGRKHKSSKKSKSKRSRKE